MLAEIVEIAIPRVFCIHELSSQTLGFINFIKLRSEITEQFELRTMSTESEQSLQTQHEFVTEYLNNTRAEHINIDDAQILLLPKRPVFELQTAECLLTAWDSERYRTMSQSRRLEFLLGRLCAALLLKQSGCRDLRLQQEQGPGLWSLSPKLHVSISHDREFCGAAIHTQGAIIGFDVQDFRPLNRSLLKRLCSSAEQQRLGICGSKSELLLFSAKEAIFKLLSVQGTTISNWHAIDCLELSAGRSSFQVTIPNSAEIRFFICKQRELPGRVISCVY
jgi:4'-phosphopantetheinyl transferase EntD